MKTILVLVLVFIVGCSENKEQRKPTKLAKDEQKVQVKKYENTHDKISNEQDRKIDSNNVQNKTEEKGSLNSVRIDASGNIVINPQRLIIPSELDHVMQNDWDDD